jgi:UDP-N-acetylmuramyl pentapeptide synthase
MIVEEKNRIAKAKGEAFLSSDEKKKAVLTRISEWISNLTGSSDKAFQFIDSNQSKIESIIDEYISFSNKMQGKNTLSEVEKLIQEQLKK